MKSLTEQTVKQLEKQTKSLCISRLQA